MENLLIELADKKETLTQLRQQMQSMILGVTESEEYKNILEQERITVETIDELDTKIREGALEYYKLTGDKKPYEGVGIRVMTKITYDDESALNWCENWYRDALVIDKKMFDKFVRKLPEESLPIFVSIEYQPTATISADLSYWRSSPEQ